MIDPTGQFWWVLGGIAFEGVKLAAAGLGAYFTLKTLKEGTDRVVNADDLSDVAVGSIQIVGSAGVGAASAMTGAGIALAGRACGALAAAQTVTVYRIEGLGNQRVLVGTGGQPRIVGKPDRMLWLNFGDKARAEAFLRQRLAKGFTNVSLKSFEVPRTFLEELRAQAIRQSQGRALPSRPQVGDPRQAADQFGLTAEQIETLKAILISMPDL